MFLVLVGAPPANAQWSEQYWFGQLSISQAWSVTKGAGITVAVVDSGVDGALGDLKGQVLAGTDFSGQHTDGRSDAGDECDKLGCYGHGTDMSLVIAGTGAGSGYQGIAPGVKILPVKVQTKTGQEASATAIADGIRFAVDHGAKVVNVSLGHPGSCDSAEGAAVEYAYDHDVIVVSAAGNDGLPNVESPANCPGALGVSATNGGPEHGALTTWSKTDYGPEVAFSGIGVDMPQELLSGTKVLHANGTSQAAAMVSGSLALIRAHFPKMAARDVVARALWNVHTGAGANKIGHRINDKIGYGMILPYAAMTRSVPSKLANPIYDTWQKDFATQPSSGAPSNPSSSSHASIPSGSGAAPSPVRKADSGGSSSGALIGVIVGVVALVLIVVAVVVIRQRSRAPRTRF